MKKRALEKFLRYVKIDTASDPKSTSFPSTKKQFDLAKMLQDELKEIGLKEIELDDNCYLTAKIESNIPNDHSSFGKAPTIAFFAHIDTSPDLPGSNVTPIVHENYQGGDIIICNSKKENLEVILKESDTPNLKKCHGDSIVTSDGRTLLGADDKAGIAAIMTAVEQMKNDNSILHGDVLVCFSPDEEIGQGMKYFDVKRFGADYAYTIDGDMAGILNDETFSADSMIIKLKGVDIHPGTAKDIMVNSARAMCDIVSMLPKEISPEHTSGHESYIHPARIKGGVGESEIEILLRHFKTEGLTELKKQVVSCVEEVKGNYKNLEVEITVINYYRNMKDELKRHPLVLENLEEAARMSGVEPIWRPIRGGTDGSVLTGMGLMAPNIYTGGQNFHARNEWLSVNALEKSVLTIINLSKIWAQNY